MAVLAILDNIRYYIMGGLLTIVVALGVALSIQSNRLDACKAGALADRAKFEATVQEAENLALRNKIEVERRYAELSQEADERFRVLRDGYNASIVRYQAAQRAGSRTDLSGTNGTGSSDGTSANSLIPTNTGRDVTIAISTDDALICAENTARLQSAREWATSLPSN